RNGGASIQVRCPFAQRTCMEPPPLRSIKGHLVACHYPLNTEELP
ncbi:peptide ABC transporter ATP-binding protein, partial [Bacillus subtilis]